MQDVDSNDVVFPLFPPKKTDVFGIWKGGAALWCPGAEENLLSATGEAIGEWRAC